MNACTVCILILHVHHNYPLNFKDYSFSIQGNINYKTEIVLNLKRCIVNNNMQELLVTLCLKDPKISPRSRITF